MTHPPADAVVWYVAYGSNLCADRFTCYLAGGRADGASWTDPGARDRSAPTADRRVELPHPRVFGGPSSVWAGGPAFLDADTGGHATGRGWRITGAQLVDVLAQECKVPRDEVRLTGDALHEGGEVVTAGRYGRLVALAPIDGEPAVTATATTLPDPRPPDPAYLAVLRRGLVQLGCSRAEIATELPATGRGRTG